MALISPQEDIHNVRYDRNTTQGSAQSCDLTRFRKTNLSTLLCTELDLGIFMKISFKQGVVVIVILFSIMISWKIKGLKVWILIDVK